MRATPAPALRMAIIKKTVTSVGRDVEKQESSHMADGNEIWCTLSAKDSDHRTQQFHSWLSIYPRMVNRCVHIKTHAPMFLAARLYNCPRVETTGVSLKHMGKGNMVQLYSGVLLSHKESSSDVRYNIDGP